MKLIIEIDEEILNKLPETELGSNVIEDALEAIENGMPLDKMIEKIEAVKILRNIVNDNAPTVDVLDKIKAEIETLNPVDYVFMSTYEGRGASNMKDDVLQIINKYIRERSE